MMEESLNDAAIGLTEMMHHMERQKEEGEENHAAAKGTGLGRQIVLPMPAITTSTPPTSTTLLGHIKVYSYYEIDHSKLPVKAPHQLNSIRVVMVSEKSETRVAVRFPSIDSVRLHLRESWSNNTRKVAEAKRLPSLDEKYLMRPEVAEEVLYRRVSADEIGENRNSWSFWVVASGNYGIEKKEGLCWSEIKTSDELVKWGKRKKIQYVGRYHGDDHNKNGGGGGLTISYEYCVKDGDQIDDPLRENEMKDCDEEEDEKAGESRELEKIYDGKRRRSVYDECSEKKKKSKKYKKVVKNSNNRWSKERYTLAEENMLKILKEKDAVYGKPILRPALRTEARKLIGDTGLLDHLLKHMAGKVAPGAQERFRRRHNADGQMEYWLESADLVDIRKKAGVQDPYWTPPPGWKLGDNPIQDPVCAKEFKQLRDDMDKMRKDMQELFKKQGDDPAMVTTQSSCATSQNFEHDSFLIPLKERYVELMHKKAKIEEQMIEVSRSLFGMEEEMEKLKSSVEESNKPAKSGPKLLLRMGSTTATSLGTEKMTKEVEINRKQIILTSDETQEDDHKPGGNGKTTTVASETAKATPENKAAKIERLKSGFRICRPQGTFLWPSMAMSPQPSKVVVPLEDLLLVPTPPSVSSSTGSLSAHCLLSPLSKFGPLPSSPVKPLSERRSVSATLTAAATEHSQPLPLETTTQFEKNYSAAVITPIASTNTSIINLNEAPCPLTYRRRNQNESGPAKEEVGMSTREEDEKKETLRDCDQKQKGCPSSASSFSCLSVGAGTWLALSTPNPPLDSNSTQG